MCKLYQIFRKSFWLQFSKCIIISNVNMCRCRFSGLGDIFIGRSELHIQLKDQRITVFYFIRYHLRDQICFHTFWRKFCDVFSNNTSSARDIERIQLRKIVIISTRIAIDLLIIYTAIPCPPSDKYNPAPFFHVQYWQLTFCCSSTFVIPRFTSCNIVNCTNYNKEPLHRMTIFGISNSLWI